jgi:hypothetical protein
VIGYEYEVLRLDDNQTMVTEIAFQELENSKENLGVKEEGLDPNGLGKNEVELLEERKTIERLKIEFRVGLKSIWAAL